MRLNHLTIGTRLSSGFALILLFSVLIAAMGWFQLSETRASIDACVVAADRATKAQHWAGLTSVNVERTLAIAKSDGSATVKAHFEPLLKATSAQISGIQKDLEASADSVAEKAMFEDIAAKRKTYVQSRDAVFAMIARGDAGAQTVVTRDLLPAAEAYLEALGRYEQSQSEIVATQVADSNEHSRRAQAIVLALCVGCVITGVAIIFPLTRSVVLPLKSVVEIAERIAKGDLSQPVQAQGRDEVGQVLHALSAMQESLQRVVGDVRRATESITVASTEVAAGSQDLSGRTEMTASSLQETASSMEQIAGTVQHSADSARTANQLASGAASAATEGGSVVSKVVSTMGAISEGSRRIADIIGVIDGIAFQTNILALNAAVEAARAGEQGRGFAVVASEVRALAHRVADAAKEIKTLISTSVDQVDAGAGLVQEAGASMAQIVEAVQRVSDVIGEISAAASEQSSGISQVNQAVSQLDQMTQQNAALVEQSTAAAESLKDQARRLAEVVAVFRLPD